MTVSPAPTGRVTHRVWSVVRLQLINTQSFLWVPLIILAGAALVAVLVFAMIPNDSTRMYGGAGNAPLWYFVALGVQAMTLSFPFSQAMSVTRREFFLGTLVVGAIGAAMMATIFLALAGIEVLTNGYGVNGYVAHLEWIFDAGWASAWLTYFTATLLLYVVGFWCATVWKRFGTLPLVAVLVALGLALVLGIFVATRTESWPQVIGWFVELGPFFLTLLGLAVTALLALGSYATLRRATV
ncbi:hypothetical protein [Microbacterium excoecariae]|uniref:hypothetical protein n=1 Tax=Microbacterium excoecariae TaxID=2715210 RepID=UPI001407BD49|nr:hypothetical protein [Microbacterium excoecariae]NHI15934.1 hypothetical protein [Microbacterium excoecariae]